MPTYDAILGQDTQFLTVPMEVSRATHYPLILAPNNHTDNSICTPSN